MQTLTTVVSESPPASYTTLSLNSHQAMEIPPVSSATLRTIYNRAARAFLNKDIILTSSLLESAFKMLPSRTPNDGLLAERRKFDILRITLETTVRSSPSEEKRLGNMRELLVTQPHDLIMAMYRRSLQLFTPQTSYGKSPVLADARFIPPAVLATLVYSGIKLDFVDGSREMIEEWLANRPTDDQEGYEKVVEIYLVQVLPRLKQWDYALEFLDYECELDVQVRQNIRAQVLASKNEASSKPIPSLSSSSSLLDVPSIDSRSHSPTPSSSSSSSLSTTSTHTVVPSVSRQMQQHPLTHATLLEASRSASSLVSEKTVRRNERSITPSNRGSSRQRTYSSSTSHPTFPRSQLPVQRYPNPSTYTLIKEALLPYLSSHKLGTWIILFVLVPIFSFMLHRRRRRAIGTSGLTTADLVRRRLQGTSSISNDSGVLRRALTETIRIVGDTVRMGGSGWV